MLEGADQAKFALTQEEINMKMNCGDMLFESQYPWYQIHDYCGGDYSMLALNARVGAEWIHPTKKHPQGLVLFNNR